MKKRGIVFKLISCFLVAIILPLAFLSIMSINKVHTILADNMKLTSFQTLKESQKGFETYLQSLSQQLNLLTRKNELKHMEDQGNLQDNVIAIEDSIVAALKITNGSLRGYYATNSGYNLTAWYIVDEQQKSIAHHSFDTLDRTQESWFTSSIGSPQRNGVFSVFSEPYIDEETGEKIITVAQEVKASKIQVGSVGMDIKFSVIEDFIQNIGLLNTGFVIMTNANGDVLVNNSRNTYITSSLTELSCWDAMKDAVQLSTLTEINGEKVNVITLTDEITGWKLVGFISDAEISSNLSTIKYFTFTIAFAGILLGIFIAIRVTATIKTKLNAINTAVGALAQGDLTQTISLKGSDEFSDLADHYNMMITSMANLIKDVDYASHSLLEMSQEIAAISTETTTTSENVYVAIGEVAHSTTNQAYRTQEASSHVDDLAIILDQTRKYIAEQFATIHTNLDLTALNELIAKATTNKDIAIMKVENIAADAEEMASAAEEVTALTQVVNQSMANLDQQTKELTQTAHTLQATLNKFHL